MKSRWTDAGAREADERWGGIHGTAFSLRIYSARLIGEERTLVLHGGGNVSVKGHATNILGEVTEVIHVKCSGRDMATLEAADLPALDLAYLRRLRALRALDDLTMVNEIRTHLLDAAAPTPSIETLLHAFLPHRFVDHSHADALIVLTNQPNGVEIIREVLGEQVAIIPYVRPGFELAKAVANALDANPKVHGAVLMQHGLFTFANDARESYERHIEIVDRCEQYIARRISGRRQPATTNALESAKPLATRIAPILRGWLSRDENDRIVRRPLLDWRCSDRILEILNSADAERIAESGPLTPDHLIRTQRWPLFVQDLAGSDDRSMNEKFRTAIREHRTRYSEYTRRNAGEMTCETPWPHVIVIPGVGLFGAGATKREACAAADIAEQTLLAKTDAFAIGAFNSLSERQLFEMEFHELERRKLKRPAGILSGQVVIISGGGGAIGSGIAVACADAGAIVVVTDLASERIANTVARLNAHHGHDCAVGIKVDVTDESSVRMGFDEVARSFGGADVIVVNAGAAHVAAIDELAVADFQRLLDINTIGSFLFLREGAKLLKRQRMGGNIIVISTKNVAAPGKDFAAYSASKAAAHQLARVAALELAPFDIRVNLLAPDAVFGDAQTPSGLWNEVGPMRAASRGIAADQLREHYRMRNLLRAEVTPRHVGNAVVFFASNATPTTGAVLPIDGGLPEAFPR